MYWIKQLAIISILLINGFGSRNNGRQASIIIAAGRTTPLFSPLLPKRCPSPPCVCDNDNFQRKVVTCSTSIQSIPIDKMDPETQVIIITSKPNNYNTLTLSRIFTNMTYLEEVHITRSRLPAIGEATFCSLQCNPFCGSQLRLLDLSQNNINSLVQTNFKCLDLLEFLDLSDNNLSTGLPSAPFVYLRNLRKLSLAKNKIPEIVPLMFHSLNLLEELDLSENELTKLSHNDLRNLPKIRTLNLSGCKLTQLDGCVFNDLTNLAYLDIGNNHLKNINNSAFANMKKLDVLLLNNNSLTVLPEQLFKELNLKYLDLSNNLINPINSQLFRHVGSIKKLDLSHNKISSFSSVLLEPLAYSLEQLTIDNNHYLIDGPSSLTALLQPLKQLRYLSATEINLDETLPESTFDQLESLLFLNLSHNKLSELNSRLLRSLTHLNTLDVSHNKLSFIDPSTFQMFHNMLYLSKIYLHGNPYSCYRCQILPFIDWLSTDPIAYWEVCPKFTNNDENLLQYCAQCLSPASVKGRYLHEPGVNFELEWCTNPQLQLRLTASEPQVGLILASLITISVIAVIMVIIAIYRKNGAVYYTQEDKIISKDDIYSSKIGAKPLNWSSTNDANRISETSINYSSSRGNTMLIQNSLPMERTMNMHNSNISQSVPQTFDQQKCIDISNGCNECVNSIKVKQVIASIPAMTEILEKSLNKMNNNPAINAEIGKTQYAALKQKYCLKSVTSDDEKMIDTENRETLILEPTEVIKDDYENMKDASKDNVHIFI